MRKYDYDYDFLDSDDDIFEEEEDLFEEESEDDSFEPESLDEEPGYTDEHTRQAQLYLKEHGYDVVVDGEMHESCKESIIKYLQFQLGYYGAGCAVNGKLNSDTIIKMKRFLPLKRSNNPRMHLVKVIQIALLYLGYDVNEENSINGVYSTKLEKAIKRFQRDFDLAETGYVNSETFIALLS